MNSELLDRIIRSPHLPTLPRVAIRVIELCRSDETSLDELVKAINMDAALVMKILATINSSYYGLAHRVVTVADAAKLLGLKSIETLTLAFCLSQAIRDQCGQSVAMEQLWRRSVYAAVSARGLAKVVRLPIGEEAFTAALLQDIGVMALMQTLGDDYQAPHDAEADSHAALVDAEQQTLALDHMEVGASVAEEWGLPAMLVMATRYHHRPDLGPERYRDYLRVIALSGLAADVLTPEELPVKAADVFAKAFFEWFGIERPGAEAVLDEAEAASGALAQALQLSPRTQRQIAAVLAEANEQLAMQALAHQRTIDQLEEEKRQWQARAQRDSLTALANRRRFDGVLTELFSQAVAENLPLSVIVLDVDHFKAINDEYGHLAGDQVLVHLGRSFAEYEPKGGCVARYGGEEFALILPGVRVAGAAQLAEQIRVQVEEMEIDIGNGHFLRVTISCGVAGREHMRTFSSPTQLVDRADQALYSAKSAGRNCVRVLRPIAAQSAKTG